MTLLDKFAMVENGKIKNAAAALFTKRPQDYPQFLLRMARFRGKEKRDFIDNMRVNGNFFELLDAGLAFLFKHLNQSGVVKGLRREEQLEIPFEALREALTNALCHRQLDSPSGSVGIAVFDDRVEIENAGHLPNELTVETIKLPHRSYPQNPIIANALYMTAYLESWGTGVSRMVDACKAAGVPEPTYGTDGLFVWITFKRPNLDTYSDTNPDTTPDTNTPLNITNKCNTSHNQRSNSDSSSDSSSDSNLLLSDRQKEVLLYCIFPRTSREILEHINVTYQKWNIDKFINTLIDAGLLERTIPNTPNSPNQKYVVKRSRNS
jgi:ATP-dependent DNA helicase RecG